MRQALSKIAVVRQNEKTFGLRVEPADIEKARELRGQEIENGVACIGIDSSRNETGGFVQDDVKPALAVHEFATDLDVVGLGRLRAEIGADAAVDCDASVRNQLVAVSPRTDAGCSEETI